MQSKGFIRAIAYRPKAGAGMILIDRAELVSGRGLDGEPGHKGKRGVTLLCAQAWADVCQEMGVQLPWTLRRANLLIDSLDLSPTNGQVLSIDGVRLLIHGETKPCGLMDQQCSGLKQALVPHWRGGVHAEVVVGGTISVGQAVVLNGTDS